MKNKHNNFKRIMGRIAEEIKSTYQIAKETSIIKAIKTLIAKIDIQIMNRNGYKESKQMKKHLLEKHNIMIDYYEKTFDNFIKNYKVVKNIENNKEDYSKCIWICWWQGLDNAPILVKKCIESIKRNAGNHKVIILTEDNYKQYVDIPIEIEDKKRKGIITRTNYSDLLRLSLLAKHGGMWLDATFFCTGNLNEYFKLPLWSIKRPDYGHASVACGNFAGYSLYCNKDNRWIFNVIRDLFINYWMNNDSMVDYLMVDYMIVLAQRLDNDIKKAFDEIPSNNPLCDELYKVMSNKYDEKDWETIKKDTKLFKLSWKDKYNCEGTFYSKILEDKLN